MSFDFETFHEQGTRKLAARLLIDAIKHRDREWITSADSTVWFQAVGLDPQIARRKAQDWLIVHPEVSVRLDRNVL